MDAAMKRVLRQQAEAVIEKLERNNMKGYYAASKAEAVEKAILGPVTEEVPASILQLHPNCTWYMDREAAAGIIGRIDENGVRIK